jgi:hypothetical protein
MFCKIQVKELLAVKRRGEARSRWRRKFRKGSSAAIGLGVPR